MFSIHRHGTVIEAKGTGKYPFLQMEVGDQVIITSGDLKETSKSAVYSTVSHVNTNYNRRYETRSKDGSLVITRYR